MLSDIALPAVAAAERERKGGFATADGEKGEGASRFSYLSYLSYLSFIGQSQRKAIDEKPAASGKWGPFGVPPTTLVSSQRERQATRGSASLAAAACVLDGGIIDDMSGACFCGWFMHLEDRGLGDTETQPDPGS